MPKNFYPFPAKNVHDAFERMISTAATIFFESNREVFQIAFIEFHVKQISDFSIVG